MILCVDKKCLNKDANVVQRKVDLGAILNNHTDYFNAEEIPSEYIPLDFAVSIRSINTNRVIESDISNGIKTYYTNITDVQEFPHKGYDLIMYLSSIGMLHNVNYKKGFDDLMFEHSQFQAIGLYYFSEVVNPIIYSHILMSDVGIKLLKSYLKSGYRVVKIQNMNKSGNIQALLDTLIITKEKNNE